MTDVWIEKTVIHGQYFLAYGITKNYTVAVLIGYCLKNMTPFCPLNPWNMIQLNSNFSNVLLRRQTFLGGLVHWCGFNPWVKIPPVYRGAFCGFPFWWIYYCHSVKSTGKKTGKTHLCAVQWWSLQERRIQCIFGQTLTILAIVLIVGVWLPGRILNDSCKCYVYLVL